MTETQTKLKMLHCHCLSVCMKESQTVKPGQPLKVEGFPGDSDGKQSACKVGDLGLIPGFYDSMEKGMTTPSSVLAQKIPWTEKAGGLQSYSLWDHKQSDVTERLTLFWELVRLRKQVVPQTLQNELILLTALFWTVRLILYF